MKIATFNINNINKGLAIFGWVRTAKPVVCLQELNGFGVAADGALEKAGYGVAWRGQKSWNGVAILARDRSAVPSA
jgi:exodeoxyribonuclease III